ncbi:MAG: hypothetical protein WDZ35_02525 [Crocinitomicaceae bacterium]
MNKGQQHIDFKKISRYFEGKMGETEKHALEAEALNDPFLYEAMEGFSAHPEGLKRVKKLKRDQRASSRSFFGSRTLSVLLVVCVVYVITLFVFPNKNEETKETISQNQTEEQPPFQDADIIRNSIDSLEPIRIEEQVKGEEIAKNKKEIQIAQNQPTEEEKEIIEIDYIPELPENDSIAPEKIFHKKINYAPSTYMEDLYVVDYTRLNRKKKDITYTRFELSGLSARYENESSKNENDLVEKEIEVPYTEYLEGAMYRFSHEHYKKALNRFLTILEQYPEDLNALFYGGHCYYNLGEYDKAEVFFRKELKHEQTANFIAFRQESKWYLSKTLLKIGRKKEAKQLLEEIISEGQFYSKKAIELLEDL